MLIPWYANILCYPRGYMCHSVMEVAAFWGTNRLAHFAAGNLVFRGGHPLFHHSVTEGALSWGTSKLPHSGAELHRPKGGGGGHPLFHSFPHGGSPLVGHKQAGALWRRKTSKKPTVQGHEAHDGQPRTRLGSVRRKRHGARSTWCVWATVHH